MAEIAGFCLSPQNCVLEIFSIDILMIPDYISTPTLTLISMDMSFIIFSLIAYYSLSF